MHCNLTSVVCLWRGCIVTKWLKIRSCSFHYNVAQSLNSLLAKCQVWWWNSKGVSSIRCWVVFEFATLPGYISETVRDKRLGDNLLLMGSHIWAFDCNKIRWPWMTLTSIRCSVIRVMRVLTKRLRLESRGLRYKVALYLSYLHIKFDDEIRRAPFEFQAQFPISLRPKSHCMTSRLCYIYSRCLLLDTLRQIIWRTYLKVDINCRYSSQCLPLDTSVK